MSSRRKSRPVRRLDLICSNLQNQIPNFQAQEIEQSYQPQDQDALTPPQLDEHCSNEDGLIMQQNSNCDYSAQHFFNGIERRKDNPPPEGVYILQPQGFSDDEDNTGNEQDPDHYERKRVRDEEMTSSNAGHASPSPSNMQIGGKPGLDLSVKRRRTDEVDGSGLQDEMQQPEEGEFPNDEANIESFQEKMKKYERLLQLLGQQVPLMEAMDQVGITQQDLVQLRQMKMAAANQQKIKESSDNEDIFRESNEQASRSTSVTATTWNPAAQWRNNGPEEFQERLHTTESPPTPAISRGQLALPSTPIKPFSSASLPPAVAAAFVASLVSNNDQSANKADLLQKILNRSSAFSQVGSPSLLNSSVQYSDNADSIDTITAGTVSSGVGSIKKGTLDPTNFDEEVFDKYISKYSSKHPCMQSSCPHINRDHFHCTDSDCSFQRFTNKSDVIRHYNMHKKRDNSLAHGFMRFAPTDDCSRQFGPCHLNGKSTHYHCLYTNCNKVYTSTSDVMTHENFHKKNQQFVSNGFERYRATESCGMGYCTFVNQRTTHFHCTRPGCQFTFKNKCDIEKHKAYHMRDDAYTRQGFKKFYKTETCSFDKCSLDRTANHFHCLRHNCGFAFTSTSQMVSHKRKHDRHDLMGSGSLSTTSQTSSDMPSSSRDVIPPSDVNVSPSSRDVIGHSSRDVMPPPPPAPPRMTSYPHLPFLDPNRNPPNLTPHRGNTPQSLVPNQGNTPRPMVPHLPQMLMPSFIYPYVASRILNRPVPSMLEQRLPVPVKFGTSVLQEAARKVLASIPSTVATAALPQNMGPTFAAKSEPPNFYPSPYMTSSLSASPALPSSGGMLNPESCSTPRDEHYNPARSIASLGLPPPAYNTSIEASPSLKVEDQGHFKVATQPEQDQWNGKRSTSPHQPMEYDQAPALHRHNEQDNSTEEQALNLSSKSDSTCESFCERNENNTVQVTDSDLPSKAVLKFFRGLGPGECSQARCIFSSCHHFHCAVEDCCAIFTEKNLVLTHTAFHEKLEQSGIEQQIAKQFSPPKNEPLPPQDPPSPRGSPNSPPPGYIALTPRQDPQGPPQEGSRGTNDHIVLTRGAMEQSDDVSDEPRAGEFPNVSMASYNPMYSYLSRMVAEKKLMYPPGNPLAPPQSQGGFMMLPSAPGGLVSSAGMSALANQFNLAKSKMSGQGINNTEPFIHIRPGMACIRRDCKYIMQNHWHCTLNRCRYVCKSLAKAQSHRQAHDSLEAYARAAKECFRSYTVKKLCPNPSCEFRLRGHYHCLKPGCQFVTIGTSKLPWHMKKHEKIAKREASGFKYYTKKEQCGKHDCKYNGLFSHYHCIRQGCAFAFQYKHQMSTHVRKHLRRMLGRSYNGMEMPSENGDIDHTNVDSGDDSLPLIVDEADEMEQRPGVAMEPSQPQNPPPSFEVKSPFMHELSQQQLAMLERIAKAGKSAFDSQRHDAIVTSPRTSPALPSNQQPPPPQTGYSDVNDVSSEEGVLDLRSTFHDLESNSNESNSKFSNDVYSTSGNSPDKIGDDEMVWYPPFPNQDTPNNRPTLTKPIDDSMFAKFRINNDVMDGFKRFESSENCGDPQCTMLFKVSHYHCTRDGCNYRFTGRTHMYKHQQHHERVAGLVRDDFKRFKAAQDCGVEGCQHTKASTHFHCLRCTFKCTDSAKVGTHRRQHLKADTLEQSGFERFRGKEDCKRDNCKYRQRNTSHFHCLQPGCSYSVVGLTGIEQHSNKHKRSELLAKVCHVNGQEIDYITHQPQAQNLSSHDESALFAAASYPQFSAAAFRQHSTNHSSSSPEQPATPTFSAAASVMTSQFNPTSLMQVSASSNAIDLSETLNLSVPQNRAGGVPAPLTTGFPAGIGLS